MNTTTKSTDALERDEQRLVELFSKLKSASLSTTMAAVGLFMPIPYADAETNASASDTHFMLAAAQTSVTQMKLGRLATRRGNRVELKEFGRRMVNDYASINGDLRSLAVQKGFTLPKSLDEPHQVIVDEMSALRDSEFDVAWIDRTVKSNEELAASLRTETTKTSDAQIKRFLDRTVPVVNGYLQCLMALKQ